MVPQIFESKPFYESTNSMRFFFTFRIQPWKWQFHSSNVSLTAVNNGVMFNLRVNLLELFHNTMYLWRRLLLTLLASTFNSFVVLALIVHLLTINMYIKSFTFQHLLHALLFTIRCVNVCRLRNSLAPLPVMSGMRMVASSRNSSRPVRMLLYCLMKLTRHILTYSLLCCNFLTRWSIIASFCINW